MIDMLLKSRLGNFSEVLPLFRRYFLLADTFLKKNYFFSSFLKVDLKLVQVMKLLTS